MRAEAHISLGAMATRRYPGLLYPPGEYWSELQSVCPHSRGTYWGMADDVWRHGETGAHVGAHVKVSPILRNK